MLTFKVGDPVTAERPARNAPGMAQLGWNDQRPPRLSGTIDLIDCGLHGEVVRVQLDCKGFGNSHWWCHPSWLRPKGGPW